MKEDLVLNLIEVQDENPVTQGEDFDFLDNNDAQHWIEIDGAYDLKKPYKKYTVEISEDKEQSKESEEKQDGESSMNRAAIEKISLTLVPVLNAKSEIAKIEFYMILKLMATKHYFNGILSGKSLVKASNDAAMEVWHTPSKYYRPKAIRK
ncbi:hypothetical protein A0J61_11219 [Choanephora cucurbitarum]|uniref:Uncharacterized protein n=1 Tax=Choanephora cucurbitarum TaxID=101091 RepID=A0A1C7MV68_9FUNG|nr:hypothetical protein A0J61_11219 [Choanephora cucurbitarum]